MKEQLQDRYLKYLELFNKYPYSTWDKPKALNDLRIIVKYLALRKKYELGHVDMTKSIIIELEELINALKDI